MHTQRLKPYFALIYGMLGAIGRNVNRIIFPSHVTLSKEISKSTTTVMPLIYHVDEINCLTHRY